MLLVFYQFKTIVQVKPVCRGTKNLIYSLAVFAYRLCLLPLYSALIWNIAAQFENKKGRTSQCKFGKIDTLFVLE